MATSIANSARPILIDDWYLTITFLVALAIQATAFAIAYTLQFDKITDLSGTSNFIVLSLLTLLLHFTFPTSVNRFPPSCLIATLFEVAWALRLGSFLFYRVLKSGADHRFDDMRSHFWRFAGFWVFQLLWVWICSLPVILLNSPNVALAGLQHYNFGHQASEIVGILFFAMGFTLEAVADAQKFQFRKSARKGDLPNIGVWSWSRHPNYFAEISLWIGIWLVCIGPATAGAVQGKAATALYASVVSPIFISYLLIFLSGIPLSEKPTAKRYFLWQNGPNALPEKTAWSDYKAYLAETSIFFPIPPFLYRNLPLSLKRTLLLDFPMFQFNEEVDGQVALRDQEAKGK